MSKEFYIGTDDRLPDSTGRNSVAVPDWAQEYSARQLAPVEQNLPLQQSKANNAQAQADSYDQYIERMHERGRYINWLGDQFSRRNQNDWYPGYGPGNGYYYPVRRMPVAPPPPYPLVIYPQQDGGNGRGNYSMPLPSQNTEFPGQNGNGTSNWRNFSAAEPQNPTRIGVNPFQPMQPGTSQPPIYNWNNLNPVGPGNNPSTAFPGDGGSGASNWSRPQLPAPGDAQLNNGYQRSPSTNPVSNWNQQYHPGSAQPPNWNRPYNQGNNPFSNWNQPYNQGNNPFSNWNQPYDQANIPFLNRNRIYSAADNPFDVGDEPFTPTEQPVDASQLSGMSLVIGPDGQQYTYNWLTGKQERWRPVPPINDEPARTVPADQNSQNSPESPQIVGMSLRIGPDGRQYTYNHVTGEQALWSPQPPVNNKETETARTQQATERLPSGEHVTQATVEHWQRTSRVVDKMVGHSIAEYDHSIPERLGCARFVSVVLNKADGLPTKAQGVEELESHLRQYGFRQLPLSKAQPGDVIIAHRYGDDYGHAAIYMGDGKVANNNSKKLRISIDDVSKFHSPEYKTVCVYRKVS